MTFTALLTETSLVPEQELAAFTGRLRTAGAVVSFTGLARPQTRVGRPVRALFLEHHPRLTVRSLEVIARETAARFDLEALRIVHRCGTIRPGEPIVFVTAASAHRRASFEAADHAMDRLKSEAVFWKREDYDEGSAWIEPTEADARDLARWSD